MVRPWQFCFLLDKSATQTIHAQLCEHIRQLIVNGHLQAGTRLASTRTVAQTIQVNRKTVTRVYEELSALGYLALEPKRGAFVLPITHVERPAIRVPSPRKSAPKDDGENLQQRCQQLCLQSIRRVALHFHQLTAQAYDHTGLFALKQLLVQQLVHAHGLRIREQQLICGGFSLLETAIIGWIKQQGGDVLLEATVPLFTEKRLAMAGINAIRMPWPSAAKTAMERSQLIEQIEKFCINYPIHFFWRNTHLDLPQQASHAYFQTLAKTLTDYQLWCIDDQRLHVIDGQPLSAYYADRSLCLTSMYGRWCDPFNIGYLIVPEHANHAVTAMLNEEVQPSDLLTMLAQTDMIKRGHFKKLIQAIKQTQNVRVNHQ